MARAPKGKQVRIEGRLTAVGGKVSNREGSTYYDNSAQCWRATFWLPGESRSRAVRAKTREAVERKRDQRRAELLAEAARAPSKFTRDTTVHEMGQWWLTTIARHRLRPSSFGEVTQRLTRGRLRDLADIPVVDLTAEDVSTWLGALLGGDSPLAANTVSSNRSTLRLVIESAAEHGLVDRNVVAKTKRPKIPESAAEALSPVDARRLIDACEDSRYGVAVALLFHQGWRVSEALGLAWSDLDLDAGTAAIHRAVVGVKGGERRLGPPKSKGSKGEHRLTPGVVDRLRRHRVAQAAERLAVGVFWPEHVYEGRTVDLVFRTPDGNLAARQHIDKLLRDQCRTLGLDPVGTHAGRRSVITSLYLAGAPIEDIARHVGHASTVTTAGYVASLGDRPKVTADLAARLLDG